jgi:hypothetical protein
MLVILFWIDAGTPLTAENENCCFRLLTLACQGIFNRKTSMSHMEGKFQSSGQLLRHSTITNTPQPVMSGVMDVCSMRYGHWGTSPLRTSQMLRWDSALYLLLHGGGEMFSVVPFACVSCNALVLS